MAAPLLLTQEHMFNRSLSATHARPSPRVVIIGCGFSGLCMGIRLKQAGIESFTIFEKAGAARRHLARQRLPGRCVRRPVALVLVLVRAEPALVAHVRRAARDQELPRTLRRQIRPRCRIFASIERSRAPSSTKRRARGRSRSANGEQLTADIVVIGDRWFEPARVSGHPRHPAFQRQALPLRALGPQL